MSTATIKGTIPNGTWEIDPVHSNASFEVVHSEVSIFRGAVKPVEGRLVAGEDGITLEGAVEVVGIGIDDENIRPHLLSPDFFDAQNNPQIRFRSTSVEGSADDLRLTGELAMAGVTRTVEARGTIRGPVVVGEGAEKIALALESSIDRTDFGMNWQMDLPSGGVALANDVKLVVELELNRA
jgi:polyisoprenoid-binding protein YceI